MKYIITQCGEVLEFPDGATILYQNHPEFLAETQDEEIAIRTSALIKRTIEWDKGKEKPEDPPLYWPFKLMGLLMVVYLIYLIIKK